MKSDIDRLMAERNLDALLITGAAADNPPMYYMVNGAGVLETTMLVKKRGEVPILIANPMEREEAAKSGLPVIERSKYDPSGLLAEEGGDQLAGAARLWEAIFAGLGVAGRIGLYGREEQGRAVALVQEFNHRQKDRVPFTQIVGEFADTVFDAAFVTKDATEVERIRTVGRKTVAIVGKTAAYLQGQRVAHDALIKEDGTPLTVADVKARIRVWLAEYDLEDPVAGTIFAVGRDAGIPHSRGEDADPITLGKTVVFDIFPREAGGGYFFDFTRTWCLGFAPPVIEQAYQDVLATFDALLADIKAGVLARFEQRRACAMLESRGHLTVRTDPSTNQGYVHSLGHGVGLNLHERPSMRDYEGNNDVLSPGCVFTIEPGLYYPEGHYGAGGFGIRIEDTVWLNPATGRAEPLAEYARDLVLPM